MYFEKYEGIYIDDRFDYEKILMLNISSMFDVYIDKFFKDKLKVDEDIIKERRKQIVGGIFTKEFAEKYLEIRNDPVRKDNSEVEEVKTGYRAIVLTNWQEYRHGCVEYTKKFNDETDKLKKLLVSPMLTKKLKELIAEFERLVTKDLGIIGDVLTDVAQELPQKYKVPDDIIHADLAWIWNIYNRKRIKLEDKQKEILDYINEYLIAEKIFK